jgi:hypothetical protein
MAALLAARCRHAQDAFDEPAAPLACRPAARFPPQHGVPKRPLRRVVRRLDPTHPEELMTTFSRSVPTIERATSAPRLSAIVKAVRFPVWPTQSHAVDWPSAPRRPVRHPAELGTVRSWWLAFPEYKDIGRYDRAQAKIESVAQRFDCVQVAWAGDPFSLQNFISSIDPLRRCEVKFGLMLRGIQDCRIARRIVT